MILKVHLEKYEQVFKANGMEQMNISITLDAYIYDRMKHYTERPGSYTLSTQYHSPLESLESPT